MSLTGEVALVTGAANGMGRAIAIEFANEGASIVAVDINKGGVDAVAAEISGGGGNIIAVEADLGDMGSIPIMLNAAAEAFGPVSILVNNAGITRYSGLMDVTEADWDQFFRVNAKGVFFTMQSVAASMIERGQGGCIINMSSVAGKGYPGTSNPAYAASKGAVIAMSYAAAQQLAPYDITVNAICPGPIQTDMAEGVLRARSEAAGIPLEELRKRNIESIPLGRMIPPEDVAKVAAFIAGPGARNITGQTFNVDGGTLKN